MRIDYVLATPAVVVRDAWVDREARKGKGASDHAPIVLDVDVTGAS
jgi:exodeoxyribonuclease-3